MTESKIKVSDSTLDFLSKLEAKKKQKTRKKLEPKITTIDFNTLISDITLWLIQKGLNTEDERKQWLANLAGYKTKIKNYPNEIFLKAYNQLSEGITKEQLEQIANQLKELLQLTSLDNQIIQYCNLTQSIPQTDIIRASWLLTTDDKTKIKQIRKSTGIYLISLLDHPSKPEDDMLEKFTIFNTESDTTFDNNSDNPSYKSDTKPDNISDKKANYRLIEDDKELEREIALIKDEDILGIDTETTGLDPHTSKVRLIQIATRNQQTIIIDCFKCNPKLIQPLLLNDAIKVFHNAKFDLQFLFKVGLEVNQKIFDTMLGYQLITAGNNNIKASLKVVSEKLLGIEVSKDEQKSDWSNSKLTASQLEYSAKDAEVLLPLRDKIREEIISKGLTTIAKIEFDCVIAVAMMEFNGMLLDRGMWQKALDNLQKEKADLELLLKEKLPSENTLFKMGINLSSPVQLKEALNRYGIKVDSTNEESLKKYLTSHSEIIEPLLKYKKINHNLNHFGDNLITKINPITGRIHGKYKQLGSQAGRFSSNNPNIQQIPKGNELRSFFIASPNYSLVIADYSQFQIRIGAEMAKDTRLIEAIKDKTDLHTLTASLVLGKDLEAVTKKERQMAKAINFGILFGLGAGSLKTNLKTQGIDITDNEAKGFIEAFFNNYQGIGSMAKKIKQRLYRGKISHTRTIGNRIRYFPDGSGYTTALNTPIQGSEADIVKLALASLVPALKGFDAKILACIHDEIIVEAKKDIAEDVSKILTDTMVDAGKRFLKLVPVEADSTITNRWADK